MHSVGFNYGQTRRWHFNKCLMDFGVTTRPSLTNVSHEKLVTTRSGILRL
jgi:hypothetical protein